LTFGQHARKVAESFCSDSLWYLFAKGSALRGDPCRRPGHDERASRAAAVSGTPAVLCVFEIRRISTRGAGCAQSLRGSLAHGRVRDCAQWNARRTDRSVVFGRFVIVERGNTPPRSCLPGPGRTRSLGHGVDDEAASGRNYLCDHGA